MTERERIKELEELIAHHKRCYYRGQAEISDAAYDALEEELRALAPDSSALRAVGAPTTGLPAEQKVAHEYPMLSLDKLRDLADLAEWMAGETCLVSDKMDGSSASLVYRHGRFTLAKTRGDGQVGENITQHFAHIRHPAVLAAPLWRGHEVEIRGEVCLSRERFGTLADEMEARGLERPKSLRNIVAGLLHKKDGFDLCRHLDFFAYEVLSPTVRLGSELEKLSTLSEEGFTVPRHQLLSDPAEFPALVAAYQVAAEESPFLTDGLVLSVNDLERQARRGATEHHPRGKIAFKLKSESAQTVVRAIEADVGRTGKLTFVGVVDPVVLSGATVQRVTLHNAKYIRDQRVNVGCQIEITRSGEVIPKHERTITENGAFEFPSACPACGAVLVTSDTDVDLLCSNELCKARADGRIANWVTVSGINNLGFETLSKLTEAGVLKSIPDLYSLKPADIEGLEKLGPRSAERIIESIAKTKTIPLDRALAGLGIDGLGRGVAKLVCRKYPSLAELKSVSHEGLLEVSGIGEVLAENIVSGLNSFGFELLEQLQKNEVVLEPVILLQDDSLAGRTFVITGTLSRPRGEVRKWIEERGGKVTDVVSGSTSYLVCNEPSASSKSKKAQSLGVAVIGEETLYGLAASGKG